MKLDSKYFDCIRIKPDTQRSQRQTAPSCQWTGCVGAGTHRAPMGRGRDGQYFRFCIDHVREYNATYNYFEGMTDTDVARFQKDAVTGHRPTWRMGVNSWGREADGEAARRYAEALRHKRHAGRSRSHWSAGFDGLGADGSGEERGRRSQERRPLRNLERRALEALDLHHRASREEIKSRFKELVKLHHPDSNGGDTSSEEKLREVIQAYNYLKQAGLV